MTPLSSAASFASMPALTFCHTRGTPKKMVGRASGSAAAISRGSATEVICMPQIRLTACAEARSAMCAAGR